MLKKFDNLRMTDIEAAEKYADDFILMRLDGIDSNETMGTVLYTGEQADLYSEIKKIENRNYCCIITGLNRQDSYSLGGFEISG